MASKNNTATFDGAVCQSVSYIDATHIGCLVPPHATIGYVDVVVGTAATLVDGYSYGPLVLSALPTIRSGGGDVLTIMGAGFASGLTSVTVGGANCGGVDVVSATQLTCISPPSSLGGDGGGEAEVVVTVDGFTDSAPHKTATYRPSMMITSVSPDSGAVAGGDTLTINGNNFLTSGIIDYQPVEYIEFTGSQYIETSIVPSGNIKIWADYQFTALSSTALSMLFGGRGPGNQSGLIFGAQSNGYDLEYAGAYTFDKNWFPAYANTNRHTVSIDNGTTQIDNASPLSAGTPGGATSAQTIVIGASKINGTLELYSKSKFYGFQMWKEGIMVRDFIPARCANAAGCSGTNTGVNANNGEYGLYDKVNGVFYRTGAGALSGGGSFATTVMVGDVPCAIANPATDITNTAIVCSLPVLSPEHAAGPVDVVVDNGFENATKVNGYEFIDVYLTLGVAPSAVGFTVAPGSSNSGYTVANVDTNSPSGYNLTLKSTTGSDLVCEDNGSYTIPSIASDGALTIAGGNHGAWGWSVVEPVSAGGAWTAGVPDEPGASDWKVIPTTGTPAQMANTSAPSASTGDDYGLYFGATTDYVQPACKYKQTLTVTVVGN
jgi:hypothetical protein